MTSGEVAGSISSGGRAPPSRSRVSSLHAVPHRQEPPSGGQPAHSRSSGSTMPRRRFSARSGAGSNAPLRQRGCRAVAQGVRLPSTIHPPAIPRVGERRAAVAASRLVRGPPRARQRGALPVIAGNQPASGMPPAPPRAQAVPENCRPAVGSARYRAARCQNGPYCLPMRCPPGREVRTLNAHWHMEPLSLALRHARCRVKWGADEEARRPAPWRFPRRAWPIGCASLWSAPSGIEPLRRARARAQRRYPIRRRWPTLSGIVANASR